MESETAIASSGRIERRRRALIRQPDLRSRYGGPAGLRDRAPKARLCLRRELCRAPGKGQ